MYENIKILLKHIFRKLQINTGKKEMRETTPDAV